MQAWKSFGNVELCVLSLNKQTKKKKVLSLFDQKLWKLIYMYEINVSHKFSADIFEISPCEITTFF